MVFSTTANRFIFIITATNLFIYHWPLYKFAIAHLDFSINSVLTLLTLTVLTVSITAAFFYLLIAVSIVISKIFAILFFVSNAIASYFINTYSVILDQSMMGNLFNTTITEASGFFSWDLLWHIFLFGIIPSIIICRIHSKPINLLNFISSTVIVMVFSVTWIYLNANTWLWFDQHAKTLGGKILPWSYVINSIRYYNKTQAENTIAQLLPDGIITDDKKMLVVLVIGESARAKNFSLYGYKKNTTPLLSRLENLYHYHTNACSTYTTQSLRCLLEHRADQRIFYEPLPSYLNRLGVSVIWLSDNWGEPPIQVKQYIKSSALKDECKTNCDYSEILLTNLIMRIQKLQSNKVFVVLHTETSHGPNYYKKYPKRFEHFTPVCKSVNLRKCSHEALTNAYDNTILYTDYFLNTLITLLKKQKSYESVLFYISDHGESLGENGVYLHGLPFAIAPVEQKAIPFIVWLSDGLQKYLPLKKQATDTIYSQHHVFHSIMRALSVQSSVYNNRLDIFDKR